MRNILDKLILGDRAELIKRISFYAEYVELGCEISMYLLNIYLNIYALLQIKNIKNRER
jgi:hypothetical protein